MTPRRPYLAFGLVASIVILALLGPINPFTHGWGGNTDDFYEHVNLLGWQARQAAHGQPFPLFSRDIAFPDGGCMFLPDPIGGSAMIPFAWIFGAVFAHNLLVFADLLLAALMVFAIVHRRTGDFAAASLAGISYAASPVMLGNVQCGIDEILQAAWLPWVIDRALILVEREREAVDVRSLACPTLLLAASLAVCTLGQWYYGIYAYLAAGLIVATHLVIKGAQNRSRLAVAGLAAAVLGALVVAWPASLFTSCFKGGGSLFYLGSMDFYITRAHLLITHSVDPAYLFSPRPASDDYLHLGYLGYVLPALLGFAVARKPRLAGGLVALGAVFVVLSFGPLLGWNGDVVRTESGAIRLPYFFLYKAVPFFKEMRLPYRFFLAFSACASLALGVGWAGFGAGKKKRFLPFVLAAAALLAETALHSGAPVPMASQNLACSPAARELVNGEGAVLDLPIAFGPAARGWYLVEQLCHNRPLPYGVQGKDFAPSLRGNSFINLLYAASAPARRAANESTDLFKGTAYSGAGQALADLSDGRIDDEYLRGWIGEGIAALAATGVTDIAYHSRLDAPDSMLPKILRVMLGEPRFTKDGIEVFAVTH